jgi:hypothetical protein
MKKLILILIAIVFFNTLQAQDLILKKNGDEISAKIEEVGITEIKYKKFDNQEGPMYTMLKSEIFMIKYANGTKEVFGADAANTNVSNNNTVAPPANQDPATAIIYRKGSPSGFAVVYDIYADTRYLTKVTNNSYFVTKVNPGPVTFSAQTEPPKVAISMTLEPGKIYYIKCGVNSGMWIGRPSLEFVSEGVGVAETSRMNK